jgi:hypothetical protein
MTLRSLDLKPEGDAGDPEAVRIFRRPRLCSSRGAAKINADYPKISRAGAFPSRNSPTGPRSAKFVAELKRRFPPEAFEEKFGLDLAGRPTTTTVRGQCSPKGWTDPYRYESKIITVLIYMNPSWENSGGRLRLLKSADNLDDMIMEVPPTEGTLLAFKRADNSWHGHKSFAGERRVIQFNWVTSEGDRRMAMLRHHVSAPLKRLFAAMRPSAA